MENFKREIWKKDGHHFEYDSLNQLQIHQILDRLAKICNASIDSIDSPAIFAKISEILGKEDILLSINEKDGFKDMCSLLKVDVSKNSTIYVIWNYNNVDEIKTSVLQEYWDYIWYGTSDEMCLLYFSDIESLVMITDYGTIYSTIQRK